VDWFNIIGKMDYFSLLHHWLVTIATLD